MKPLKKRIVRRASYLAVMIALVLTGCGVGRYNNQVNAMKWPENTTYFYNSTGQYVGSSVNFR
jgi:hypothetical protein